ncbi:thermonuclease family protein [Rhizobium sp. C4]|uniref:thermonuclease family protein n=1 Tax=Rhizobium sp. C4 TaxID=1349800 RepID=UPI001E503933|nr:thermonuclease family protein [Rhizobium sp. C4]MCD2174601.1 hypothetical protein [Rhizobium sp. C4]
MRFLFLALLMIAGIIGAVILMQKGQARIAAQTPPPAATTPDATRAQAMPTPQAAALPTPATPPPMENLPKDPALAPLPAGAVADKTAKAAPAEPSRQKPAEPAAPAFQIVAKPAIAAAGILETTRGRVTLTAIDPLDPSETCGTGSSTWPCGQLAATQFGRFLRGRSVNCDIPDPAWQGEVTARCTLGKEDIAAWLVENGWARARPGSPYEEAGRAAQTGRRGIFGPDPRHP